MTAPSLLWFRQDLRLADHPALQAAASSGPVVGVYVLDEAGGGPWRLGGAQRWWLHHSLAALGQALAARGGTLVLRRGDPVAEIPRLAAEVGAGAVHVTAVTEPWARRRDEAVATALRGAILHAHAGFTLFDPATLRTGAGGVYGVFSPFARACRALPPPPEPREPPDRTHWLAAASDRLEDWHLLPTRPDWAGGLRESWVPGEAGARARLEQFLRQGLGEYDRARDLPGRASTSRLSPHLHWGEIAAGRVWHEAARAPGLRTAALTSFHNELLWREFSAYLLWHLPHLPEQPLRPAFAAMPWRRDPRALRAWQRGRTGVPIVDAGMRQLWQTGWMHNRVRMIVASFLVKHLLLPWQDGEAWFWDTLVDADLGANAASWQWVAGSGADAAPYFRVFNPVLQGRKFDADGAYVRAFVPEVRGLSDAHLHAPWEAPEAELAAAGVRLGETYPRPVVDLAEGRARALAAFHGLGQGAGESAA
jgi:deoxyribodipyrimidine photo-lyase